MTGSKRLGKRRTIVVAAGVVCVGALSAGFLAAPAFATETAVARDARQTPLVEDTPCTITARACVDLEKDRAWLIEDGKILRGPVDITSGGAGKETPTGHSLRVYRKEQMHLSAESKMPDGTPAKMPWSVFFENGGIAFHGGSLERQSAGCIHLSDKDAKAWYDYLTIGDQVQVVYGQQELAARRGEVAPEHDKNSDADPKEDVR
jgi:lipoprotein-anchoring transpeptidase ErfK/SrfK